MFSLPRVKTQGEPITLKFWVGSTAHPSQIRQNCPFLSQCSRVCSILQKEMETSPTAALLIENREGGVKFCAAAVRSSQREWQEGAAAAVCANGMHVSPCCPPLFLFPHEFEVCENRSTSIPPTYPSQFTPLACIASHTLACLQLALLALSARLLASPPRSGSLGTSRSLATY